MSAVTNMKGDPIIIIRRNRDIGEGVTGLGRYADSVERCIRNHEVIELFVQATLKNGPLQLLKNGVIGPLILARRACSKSSIIHATDELCGVVLPFVKGRKILTIHHIVKSGESSPWYYAIWKIITFIGAKSSDVVIAISEQTMSEAIEFGIPPQKIRCINNAVDQIFKPLDVQKEDLIGCNCELIPRKNVKDSILAFNALSKKPGMESYKMVICGKGQCKEQLSEMISDLKLESKISFVSDLDDDDLVLFYNRCKVLLNTSVHEGFGYVTLEAQRCGTPVFHLNKADIPEIVTKMSIGCESPEDIAEKAYDLISDGIRYNQACRESIEYADSLGRIICTEYRAALFGKEV